MMGDAILQGFQNHAALMRHAVFIRRTPSRGNCEYPSSVAHPVRRSMACRRFEFKPGCFIDMPTH